jgi:Nucleotidyl transferase AbiEii toxin, Type IV TA system
MNWWRLRSDSRRLPPGTLDASGIQVRARGRCAGDAQAESGDQHPGARELAWHQTLSVCRGKRLVRKAEIASFEPEELFGTKLPALLQRRRNRDLFDLHQGLEQVPLAPRKIVACFDHYLALEGKPITRAIAEQRMLEKLTQSLTEDVAPMLPSGVPWSDADAIQAFERVWTELIARISGEGWKLADAVIEELRAMRYPGLLMHRDRQRPE